MRLQLLESPPAPDVESLALQVGLTLVFETEILGAISGVAANAFLRPLARAEAGAQRAAAEAAQAVGSAEDAVASSWLRVRRAYPRATVGTSSPLVGERLAANLSTAEKALGNARDNYMRLAVQAERAASTQARFRRLVGGEEAENVGGAIQAAAVGLRVHEARQAVAMRGPSLSRSSPEHSCNSRQLPGRLGGGSA